MAKIKTKIDISGFVIDETTALATKQFTKADIQELIQRCDGQIQTNNAQLAKLAEERAALIDATESLQAQRTRLVATLAAAPDAIV